MINLRKIVLFHNKNKVVTHLGEMVLMKGQNIYFQSKVKEIIPKLFLLPFLVWSNVSSRYRGGWVV